MPGKPPSVGQKVTLGADAPVTQESTGAVAPDSLAAESSAFTSSNRTDGASAVPHSRDGAASSRRAPRHASSSDEPASQQQPDSSYSYDDSTEQGGPAPTYVNNQYYRDPKGPHGKNLKEGFDDGRPGDSLSAKPGSKDDPGRVAEEKFRRRNEEDSDETERKGGLGSAEGDQPYGVLGNETSA